MPRSVSELINTLPQLMGWLGFFSEPNNSINNITQKSTQWCITGCPRASTVKSTIRWSWRSKLFIKVVKTTDLHTSTGARACCMRRVAAKHGHARTKFGTTKGDHVFSKRKEISLQAIAKNLLVRCTEYVQPQALVGETRRSLKSIG